MTRLIVALCCATILCTAMQCRRRPATSTMTVDVAVAQAGFRQLWKQLPTLPTVCGDFDYYPDGGMRNFYCHVQGGLPLRTLAAWAGIPIYLRGPHRADTLNLTHATEFGHYNPAFVTWLRDHAIPAAEDEAFRRETQPIYDRYVARLAFVYLQAYAALEQQPTIRDTEIAQYAAHATATGYPRIHERYYDFVPCARDGNVSSAAVAFWLRRYQDHTAAQFAAALELLMRRYAPDDVRRAKLTGDSCESEWEDAG